MNSEEKKLSVRSIHSKMLKISICRLNCVTTQNLANVARKSAAFHKNYENKNSSNESNHRHNKSNSHFKAFFYASLPPFLAFYQKKDDKEKTEPSFLESVLPEGIYSWMSKKPEEDLTPKGELKTILQQTILCTLRKEFDKAEEMTRLALQKAQEIQCHDGITFCYDIMANLALERKQFDTARKLFESVLQRLLQSNVPQDDIRVCIKAAYLSLLKTDIVHCFSLLGPSLESESCSN